jgi:threonine dehydrogenase-like Zn-dependent dehydrogenase
MRAIVIDHPGSFRVAELPDPTPGPGQIVVKVDCCGVCGTDLHIMNGEFPPTPYPITPGHEFAGTVAAVGSDVSMDLPIGAMVAVDPSLYCGYCRRCRSGRDNGAARVASSLDDLEGERFEIAVDATGVPAVIDGTTELLGRGGRLLVFGVSPAEASIILSPFRVYNDELTVTGSMAILRSFAPAAELIVSGVVDPRPLLSEPLPLDKFGEALCRVKAGQGIKWHIRPSANREG